jgi:sarcosine oxidase delta subunit
VITCPHCPKKHRVEFTVGIHPIFIPCDCGKIINGTAIVSPGGRASIDRVV